MLNYIANSGDSMLEGASLCGRFIVVNDNNLQQALRDNKSITC